MLAGRAWRGGAPLQAWESVLFTQDVFAKRTILKRQIEQRAIRATLVLPASLVLLVLLVLPVIRAQLVLHTTRPTYAHCLRSSLYRVYHAPSGLLCVLYALSYSQAGKHEIRGKTA